MVKFHLVSHRYKEIIHLTIITIISKLFNFCKGTKSFCNFASSFGTNILKEKVPHFL